MAVPALNSVLWELILFFCCPSFRNLTCSCWQASAEQKSQRQWAPPPLREGNGYGSSDTEYPYSGSDDDVSDGPYSDDNSDDIQPSARSSGESSGESEVDQVEVSEGQQAMDITIEDSRDCASETAVRPQSEGMPMETTRASTSQVPLDILAFDVNTMHRLLDPHEDRGRAVAEISNEDFAASSSFVMTETASLVHEVNERASFRLHSASGEGASDRGTGSSGDEGEEQCTLTAAHTALSLGITGTRHVSPICYENHYREFMIATLPGLQVLDNVAVTYCERERARSVCKEHFELVANNRREPENVIQVG
jgi:hypothetical protein